MRFNNPEAAALTVVGLCRIDDAFSVFSMPFFFESYDELYAVLERMRPTLSERLDRQNLVFIAWANTGWAHVFTTRPVRTVAELKQIKLFTSAGDNRMVQWYKTNGFQPRALAMTDILTGVDERDDRGTADHAHGGQRVPVVPADEIHAQSRHRSRDRRGRDDEEGLAGAVPDADRERLLGAAEAMETRLALEIPRQDRAAVEEMKKRGLVVTAAEGPEWRTLGQAFATSMRGAMVPADVYDQVVRERDAYRRTSTAAP